MMQSGATKGKGKKKKRRKKNQLRQIAKSKKAKLKVKMDSLANQQGNPSLMSLKDFDDGDYDGEIGTGLGFGHS